MRANLLELFRNVSHLGAAAPFDILEFKIGPEPLVLLAPRAGFEPATQWSREAYRATCCNALRQIGREARQAFEPAATTDIPGAVQLLSMIWLVAGLSRN
jgi:hypothetical protein